MRLGILPNLDPHGWRVYQYTQTFLHALEAWSRDGCEDRLVVFLDHDRHPAFVSQCLLRRTGSLKVLFPGLCSISLEKLL